jgi:hypothetical protein
MHSTQRLIVKEPVQNEVIPQGYHESSPPLQWWGHFKKQCVPSGSSRTFRLGNAQMSRQGPKDNSPAL